MAPLHKPIVAFGPELADWGSWNWVGADLQQALSSDFRTVSFQGLSVPPCDVAVFVKHAPPVQLIDELARRARVIYCPVDYYGSAAEIDADARMLRRCSRVVIHCERLRRYFQPYARVEYLDHHVKFVAPSPPTPLPVAGRGAGVRGVDGYILWVGVRTNLPPLVRWVHEHPLPCELRILTNLEDPARVPAAEQIGFSGTTQVRIEHWSAERQIQLCVGARAAIDIKGDDFRSRHKPPAKGIDFIASGVPLAMNADSSTTEHLARMGFELASPLDTVRWFSRDYWEDTRSFGLALRELLSLRRVARRFKSILEMVLCECALSM